MPHKSHSPPNMLYVRLKSIRIIAEEDIQLVILIKFANLISIIDAFTLPQFYKPSLVSYA